MRNWAFGGFFLLRETEQGEKMGQRERQSKGSGPPPAQVSSLQFNQVRGETKLGSGGPAAV